MQTLRNFRDMAAHLAAAPVRRHLVVVCPYDACTVGAAMQAVAEGFADVTFVGERSLMEPLVEAGQLSAHVRLLDAASAEDAAQQAVALVRSGQGCVLMKGLVNTDVLLRAVLAKDGLLPPGAVLTHVAVAEMPAAGAPAAAAAAGQSLQSRLLFFSDAAVIPYPTHEQRRAQVGYLAQACRAFGIASPRISLLHCSEKVSAKFPHTGGYADLVALARAGEWGDAVVDGPLDLRTSLDASVCAVKGIRTPLGGLADALVFPDIEAANVFYKALPFFAGLEVAGMLAGTVCPVVLTSRGDTARVKYHSIVMAAVAAGCAAQTSAASPSASAASPSASAETPSVSASHPSAFAKS